MPETATATSQVAPLQVSAHTMALEPGLYCVFSAPGGPAPDTITGLPAARITAAPGKQAGQVELVGLDPGGWIGRDAATLVRIGLMKSELLVTVYQARDSKVEAPKLQVVRISGAEDSPKAAPAAPGRDKSAPERMDVVSHIYGMGDVGSRMGEWSGVPGSKRWIEGFGIAPSGAVPEGDIEYQAVLGRGWLSPWSPGGQFCGSRAMSLPILGLRVRLRGNSAKTYAISLTATFVDGTKVGPVKDGEPCEAQSLAALEAFQVSIRPATGAAAMPSQAAQARAPRLKKAAEPVLPPVTVKPAKAKTTKPAAPAPVMKTVAKPKAKPAAAPVPKTLAKTVAKTVAKSKAKPAPAPAPAPAAKPAARKPGRRG